MFLGLLFLSAGVNAQADTLPTVKVKAHKNAAVVKSTVPYQQLTQKDLSKLNSLSVADAAKYFSGVLIKDYGGIGGLKTISVRSLGANHTGVMYDGMMVGDAQGGQIDLGRFSLDNVESLQLFISAPDDILVPARSYARASVLSINSSGNQLNKRKFTAKINAGSFGFLNPSFSFKSKTTAKFSTGFNAEYQRANGEYPYKNYVNGGEKSKRLNSDIESYRAEYDAAYSANDSNKLKFKLYYYYSDRGLPSFVNLYNNFSDERLKNEIFFAQTSWQKSISAKSKILLSAKFSKDYKFYLDPTYPNSAGKLENKFHQQELYVSAAYHYKISEAFAASYASDYFKSELKRTDDFAQGFANPQRDNFLNNIALSFEKKLWSVRTNLLLTSLKEKVQQGNAARDLNKVSPVLSASYKLSKNSPFHLRAFYKKIYRVPSFDDLYYTNVGNVKLKPELANQYNIGFTFNSDNIHFAEGITLTADGYYNEVKDKIIAAPSSNIFQWTMLNIAKVKVKGADITVATKWKNWKGINFTTRLSYSFQDAKDYADANSPNYKKQIPYTPKHSGALIFGGLYKNFSATYNVLWSSFRYRLGDQIPENLIKEWATSDLTFAYDFKHKKNITYRIHSAINNLFNKQYEILKYYPMPGINYRMGFLAIFN